MRVLFLGLKIFSTGGIEQVCKNWLYALRHLHQNKKIKFSTISMYDSIADERYINKDDVTLCDGNKWMFGLNAIWSSIRSDLVIIPHLNLSLFVLIAKLINPKLKVVVQLHGIEAWANLSGVQERLLLQADKVLAVSNFTLNNIIERYPQLKFKASVLSNSLDPIKSYGIDENINVNFRNKLGIASGEKLIITVGRLSHEEGYKGYDKTLEAFYRLNDKSFVFHIIGKYDEIEKQRIFDLLIKYDLIDNVKLVGYTSDEELNMYYQAADLFVMPSNGEGFGLVFIDAMANGLRVIGGNVDGSVDAICQLNESALINPYDIDELSVTIKRLLNVPWGIEQKIKLSEKCKSIFSAENFEQNIESVIL
jgi:phosphatidylinositol alpha-1,6-mannosyltransferase